MMLVAYDRVSTLVDTTDSQPRDAHLSWHRAKGPTDDLPVNGDPVLSVLRYIERNPVAAGLASREAWVRRVARQWDIEATPRS